MLKRTQNQRYRLLTYGETHYLIDMDTQRFLVWFLPWLVWFLPFRSYKVDDVNEIQLAREEKKGDRAKLFKLTAFMSVLMNQIITEDMSSAAPIPNHEIELFIFLIVLSLTIIICRIIYSKRKRIDASQRNETLIRIEVSKYFKENRLLFLAMVIICAPLIFTFWVAWTFISGGNVIALALYIVIATLFFFLNQLIRPPEKFDIKIIEE